MYKTIPEEDKQKLKKYKKNYRNARKREFHNASYPIYTKDIDVYKIIVSNKASFGKKVLNDLLDTKIITK